MARCIERGIRKWSCLFEGRERERENRVGKCEEDFFFFKRGPRLFFQKDVITRQILPQSTNNIYF